MSAESFDVSHSKPSWVSKDDEEENQPGSEGAQNPLDAGIVDRSEGQDRHRRGKNDPVRDQPVFEIGARDYDQYPAEEHRDQRFEREAEDEPARPRQQSGACGDEQEPRRPRGALQERLVNRRIRRETIGERADGDAGQQSDEASSDVHVPRFRVRPRLPASTLDRCPSSRG